MYVITAWITIVFAGSVHAILVPHFCNNGTFHDLENVYMYPCPYPKSTPSFTVPIALDSHFEMELTEKLDLRVWYISCNATDNRTITLTYNHDTTQMVHLCPDHYPGYYYGQYFYANQNGVENVAFSIKFGDNSMNSTSCIHDHNRINDNSLNRLIKQSARFPAGGVYPIRCSMYVWYQVEHSVQGENLAAYTAGGRCNYWRPGWGMGREVYCKRLLDGYIDPWEGMFAVTADTQAGFEGIWIMITFPEKHIVTTVAWVQYQYPRIRRFLIEDGAGNSQYINCSRPMSNESSVQWEAYNVGPFTTEQIVITLVDVVFYNQRLYKVGFYEIEVYGHAEESSTAKIIQKSTAQLSSTSVPETRSSTIEMTQTRTTKLYSTRVIKVGYSTTEMTEKSSAQMSSTIVPETGSTTTEMTQKRSLSPATSTRENTITSTSSTGFIFSGNSTSKNLKMNDNLILGYFLTISASVVILSLILFGMAYITLKCCKSSNTQPKTESMKVFQNQGYLGDSLPSKNVSYIDIYDVIGDENPYLSRNISTIYEKPYTALDKKF